MTRLTVSSVFQRFASLLAEEVASLKLLGQVIDMRDYDPDDCLVEEVGSCPPPPRSSVLAGCQVFEGLPTCFLTKAPVPS